MPYPLTAERAQDLVGKPLEELPTPAFVIDRHVFAENCAKMHRKAKDWNAAFRAHLKTHKECPILTSQGTRLQMVSKVDKTHAVVVSTLQEAWQVAHAGLVKENVVKDILYGLPVSANKLADLAALWNEIEPYGGIVRLLIDHPEQVKLLEQFGDHRRWSAFVKVDGGQKRAGVVSGSRQFEELILALFKSPAIEVYGFYCHAGNAYASKSLDQASSFLSAEVETVNTAAGQALAILSNSQLPAPIKPFVLSVGSTPTAHAASAEARAQLAAALHGNLELHAGNYPMLDLQQYATGMIDLKSIAQKVVASVVSIYPHRGEDGDEVLLDAGALAFSKDTGPLGGYGDVIGKNWRLSRMSQEHGILTRTEGDKTELKIGEKVEIVGQHACLIAAAYPWYYIVDSEVDGGRTVVDIWVPVKGW